jgi:hypothetical protein
MGDADQLSFLDNGDPSRPASGPADEVEGHDDEVAAALEEVERAERVAEASPEGTVAAGVLGDVAGGAGAVRSFQASAGIQGRQFAEQCDTLLAHLGFTLRGRRVLAEVGVEIDQEAVSPGGAIVWFEYKGSVQGNRPGLRRTDTLKKAIANGALLRSLPDPAPYVVVTSHLPEAGAGAAMLDAALRLRYLADVVCLYDPKATARLRAW